MSDDYTEALEQTVRVYESEMQILRDTFDSNPDFQRLLSDLRKCLRHIDEDIDPETGLASRMTA